MPYLKINISLLIIVLLLTIYVVSLNFAVSEAFYREKFQRDLKILRQDLQKNEEFLIAKLSEFYSDYSEAFVQNNPGREEFVSRRQNLVQSFESNFR